MFSHWTLQAFLNLRRTTQALGMMGVASFRWSIAAARRWVCHGHDVVAVVVVVGGCYG